MCSIDFRLDEKKAVKSKSWQRYIRNDPLMYHGGYKFGAAQVDVITDENGVGVFEIFPQLWQMLKSETRLVDRI